MNADMHENCRFHGSSDSRLETEGATIPEFGRTTSNDRRKDLNFKVPAEFHRQFKMTAVRDGLKMNELLIRCFAGYIERNGG